MYTPFTTTGSEQKTVSEQYIIDEMGIWQAEQM